MTVSFDPGADFADVVDALEAVTLKRRGSSSDVSVSNALQRAISTREIGASYGMYLSGDVAWHLPVEEVATSPQPGDDIIDAAGDYWKVLAVGTQTVGTRWRCVTRNLVIAYGLDDTIIIEKATFTKGTAGAAEAAYGTWRAGVRARIQEIEITPGLVDDAAQSEKRYTIWLSDDYALDHNHRIRDRKGQLYRITRITGAESIGQLQTVEAEPWR